MRGSLGLGLGWGRAFFGAARRGLAVLRSAAFLDFVARVLTGILNPPLIQLINHLDDFSSFGAGVKQKGFNRGIIRRNGGAGMEPTIEWLGHDSFRLSVGGKVIYIDPWKLKAGQPKADLILITHDHFDHFSKDDIQNLSKPSTIVVAPPVVTEQLQGNTRAARPHDSLTAAGVPIEIVPAYNLNKFREPGKVFHPKEASYVGYIVTLGGKRIYHTGDTDHIPEINTVKCDIALVPVSGTYVMTAKEAAAAVNQFKPGKAIPMHYDDICGTRNDAEEFKKLAKVPVEILEIAK
jgi:L-ascorbate metabolism protein UlaG (beta-lactamase superfamily)